MARPEQQDHRTDSAGRRDVNRRLRAAWIAGAEHASRSRLGRGLTRAELLRVIARYRGDIEEE